MPTPQWLYPTEVVIEELNVNLKGPDGQEDLFQTLADVMNLPLFEQRIQDMTATQDVTATTIIIIIIILCVGTVYVQGTSKTHVIDFSTDYPLQLQQKLQHACLTIAYIAKRLDHIRVKTACDGGNHYKIMAIILGQLRMPIW
jgi:hypothetical protein